MPVKEYQWAENAAVEWFETVADLPTDGSDDVETLTRIIVSHAPLMKKDANREYVHRIKAITDLCVSVQEENSALRAELEVRNSLVAELQTRAAK